MESMERLLFWLLDGTRGGPTRILLLSILAKKPMNLHRLSLAADLDYKTVEHHVKLLLENAVIECTGSGYGKMYFVSDIALAQKGFREMLRGGKNGGKQKK
jgi:DNA-binding transcriptional ArsR family regulator